MRDRHTVRVPRVAFNLSTFRTDDRGNIAVMMAFLLPILIGGLGLGFEASNWYMQTRAMQNAADSAVIAAATNNSSNYDVEAKAVAAQYGFVDGQNNVTVTASNTATCPSGGNTCYSVTITSMVPIFLAQVVGYQGDTTVSGVKEKTLSSAAIAQASPKQQPICLLGLNTTGKAPTAIQGNGSPKTTFNGCTIMSDSNATCNGSNLLATYGLASGTNGGGAGCGNTQMSKIKKVPDPWATYASAIPPQSTLADASHCKNSYSNEKKKGSTWSGGVTWSGSKSLTGTASVGGNTLICGDLRLTGDVTINASGPDGAVLFIDQGNLDLNGFTLSTNSGSAVTIVFTGASGGAAGAPIDNSGGGGFSIPCNTNGSCLNIQAPSSTTAPFPGMAIYQDPNMTTPTNFTYAGNSPTWDITGGVYMPYTSIDMKGAINKSANGATCMVMVANDVTVDGTGSIYAQTPDGSGCNAAGLNVPTATIPGRSQLVY